MSATASQQKFRSANYCGRFAPSPTGPLHFGSLVAAVASFLDARAAGGRWLLRIDDLDRPRCRRDAADLILHTLDIYGLHHDGEVVWQSERDAAYAVALATLQSRGHVYPCACTRRELADSRLGPDGSAIYPGTCRAGLGAGRLPRAWRCRVDDAHIRWTDRVQGDAVIALASDCGDFLVKRADGLFAYQLAVVVDDAEVGVTDIVRGADLFHATARQIHLQHLLELPVPRYAHVPAVVNAAGEKLSKQTRAAPLDLARPVPALWRALQFLGQNPPTTLGQAARDELLDWAIAHWRMTNVPRQPSQPETETATSC